MKHQRVADFDRLTGERARIFGRNLNHPVGPDHPAQCALRAHREGVKVDQHVAVTQRTQRAIESLEARIGQFQRKDPDSQNFAEPLGGRPRGVPADAEIQQGLAAVEERVARTTEGRAG